MVKICNTLYPQESEEKYNQYFEKYPYSLSSFQKYAIEAIVEGDHILVTAHTGSGKTLPAEFAIEYFVSKGKKVIYTSPIKALSNQKFFEFTQKFPHISFGILTGDIKTNPEADVLIMTTEILLNSLYSKCRNNTDSTVNSLSFDMDFDNELACVVFDEIHYINDPDRGKVWEETIMMLPKHIQMVMLSATLDSPEKFALWCETKGESNCILEKQVYLATTNHRVVPLTHYSFITCTQGLFKVLKDKQLEMEIMKTTNRLHTIQDSKGNFNDLNYLKINKTLNVFHNKDHFVKRQHVLNSVAKHLVDNKMLPAICFVLSRKALEQCAKELTTVLLEDDSKVPYIVRKECEQIIRKLPNFEEYIQLPEYNNLVSLLEKGIAIHHAGMMPVLREMVELLFAKGYVKLLFATETFAVGINMPTKTVLFTDLNKFDGSNMRPLYSHEYTQMAGRAGRRGIDTVGHVIHLTNLFKNIDMTTCKIMMKGKPQSLMSKFKVSYNLILNLIDIGETDYTQYAKRSMLQKDIDSTLNGLHISKEKQQTELNNLLKLAENCVTPYEIAEEYMDLKAKLSGSVNKKRKEIERRLQTLKDQYKSIEKDVIKINHVINKRKEIDVIDNQIIYMSKNIENSIDKVKNILINNDFIMVDNEKLSLTSKGKIAVNIRETHCLAFAELLESKALNKFEASHLAGIFSCFTSISVPEENRIVVPHSDDGNVQECVRNIDELYKKYLDIETNNMIETGINYGMHFDLIDYIIDWCDCQNNADCQMILNKLLEKDIFLGEFVKAILKINNISAEMERVAEIQGDMEFLCKLKQIPELTLKYVATNQSLYI